MPVPIKEESGRKKNKRGSKEFLSHHPKKLHLGQFLVNLSSTQTKIPNHINFFNQIPMTDFP
jgi:ribosomal protein L32